MKLCGIAGCTAPERQAQPTFRLLSLKGLGPILREARQGEAIVVIDMPIGLPDREARACDSAARQVVGPARASSVFPVPCRAAVYAGQNRASAVKARKTGRKLSKQSLAILDRIREVDELMTPEA